jgi:hypothetical protein
MSTTPITSLRAIASHFGDDAEHSNGALISPFEQLLGLWKCNFSNLLLVMIYNSSRLRLTVGHSFFCFLLISHVYFATPSFSQVLFSPQSNQIFDNIAGIRLDVIFILRLDTGQLRTIGTYVPSNLPPSVDVDGVMDGRVGHRLAQRANEIAISRLSRLDSFQRDRQIPMEFSGPSRPIPQSFFSNERVIFIEMVFILQDHSRFFGISGPTSENIYSLMYQISYRRGRGSARTLSRPPELLLFRSTSLDIETTIGQQLIRPVEAALEPTLQ